MKFPNAYQGLKNVFTAQILMLISIGCSVVGALTGGIGVVAGSVVTGLGGGVIVLGALVLMLLSLIFTLVGLSRASRDETGFRGAFYCTLIDLILTVIVNVLVSLGIGGSVLKSIADIISLILDILVIAYIFKGIDVLAGKLGREDVSGTGHSVIVYLWVVYAVTIFCDMMNLLFPAAAVLMGVLGVVSFLAGIAMIIGYILYLVHLNRSIQMLKES